MKHRILYEGSTDLGDYQVAETIYGGRHAIVLYDRDRRAAQSGKPLDDDDDMLFDYNERFMELARGLLPKRVLLIGGGAFTLPQVLQDELPDLVLDVVELDSGLYDIAEGFFGFKKGEHTTVHVGDGREFIDTTTNVYDLIYIDAFNETSIPTSLQTLEAASSLKRILAPKGVVAMNIIAAYHGQRSAVLRRQIAAWETAFTNLLLMPASTGDSLWLPQNFVLTAHNTKHSLEMYFRHAALDVPEIDNENLIKD